MFTMDLVANLYWVIGVLSISLTAILILYFADKQAKQNSYQSKTLDESTKERMNKPTELLIDDLYRISPTLGRDPYVLESAKIMAEITRRLIIELTNFDRTTTLFSIALIILAIVQIILAIIKH